MMRSRLLKQTDLLSDILESGEHLDQIHTPVRCERLCHIGGDDGSDNRRFFRHCARRCPFPQNVLGDQHTGHIARKADVAAALRISGVDAETVRIRIRGKNKIRLFSLRLGKRQLPRVGVLRIRIRDSRERAALRILLLLHDRHMRKAQFPEDPADRNAPRPVQRRIDDAQRIRLGPDDFRVDAQRLHFGDIAIVQRIADVVIKVPDSRLILRHRLHLTEGIHLRHLRQDVPVMRRRDLGPVLPVNLVAVVFFRVVAGGDHDSRDTVKRSDRKGKLRRRPQGRKTIGSYPVRIEAQSGLF